ncbi:hypothetical protein BWP39_12470 [Paraburkholderia acidicola]|uniref:Fe-S hydro-lyase tartrate dehydratase alpha-type catalytic domain-containing protein n=1 Tax=Paraburkholderia acidicola TaxID=1912599 RepID=A0A2A4EYG3_9BURK|nr:fumarate hydratase [Paraburkholderia acidicola]PCE25334.1 hypothetical protein BWP39_12470 [Paraburkholderia acidicola]
MSTIDSQELIRQIEHAVRTLGTSRDIARIGGCSVFATLGMDVRWSDTTRPLGDLIATGIRAALPTRADTVPLEVHYDIAPGSRVELRIALTDVDAPPCALLKMLNPSDSIAEWVAQTAPVWHRGDAGRMLGLGVGGNPEYAMLMARTALLDIGGQVEEHGYDAGDWRATLHEAVLASCAAAGYPVQTLRIVGAPTHAGTKPVALMSGEPAATTYVRVELEVTHA